MRSAALSDPRVISAINEFCIAISLNVTRTGFPTRQLPVMVHLEKVYNSNWRNEFGFASCFIVDSYGKIPLGSSALVSDITERIDPSKSFSGDRYLKFIVTALERFKKVQQIEQMPPLQKLVAWKDLGIEIADEILKSTMSLMAFQHNVVN